MSFQRTKYTMLYYWQKAKFSGIKDISDVNNIENVVREKSCFF